MSPGENTMQGRRWRGFTLVELMVAMVLIGMANLAWMIVLAAVMSLVDIHALLHGSEAIYASR